MKLLYSNLFLLVAFCSPQRSISRRPFSVSTKTTPLRKETVTVTNLSSKTGAILVKEQVIVKPERPLFSSRNVAMVTTAIVALAFLYSQREWLGNLSDRERILNLTLENLKRLKSDQNESRAIVMYAMGMAGWELVGLSTIPVETAAAMVFGWKAATASAAGKLLGATLAYILGRTLLRVWAGERLSKQQFFRLISGEDSRQSAIQTAFLMKFSCVPEFVKNFGSALLPQIKWPHFFLATALHGGGFTLLWTWLGVDSQRRLQDSAATMSTGLKVMLILAGLIGLVGSPLLMAWWIRDLQQQARIKTDGPM